MIATALAGKVSSARIHLDEASVDTLQTVRAAAAFARRHGYRECVACTDRYHQPRVRMLFAMFGMRCRSVLFTPSDRAHSRGWQRMWVREAAALPYDFVAGLGRMRGARRGGRSGK